MSNYKTVAIARRIEFDEKTNKMYLVFEITDEHQKHYIQNNWINDEIEFELINQELVIKEKE